MRCEYTFLESLKEDFILPNGLFFALCLIKPQVKYLCVTVRPEAPLRFSEAQKLRRLGARAEVPRTHAFAL